MKENIRTPYDFVSSPTEIFRNAITLHDFFNNFIQCYGLKQFLNTGVWTPEKVHVVFNYFAFNRDFAVRILSFLVVDHNKNELDLPVLLYILAFNLVAFVGWKTGRLSEKISNIIFVTSCISLESCAAMFVVANDFSSRLFGPDSLRSRVLTTFRSRMHRCYFHNQ